MYQNEANEDVVELEVILTELNDDQKITMANDSSSDLDEPSVSSQEPSIEPVHLALSSSESHNHIMATEIDVSNESKDDSDYNTHCLSQIESPRLPLESVALTQLQSHMMEQFYSNKWLKLFTNDAFYGRILILILSFLLFALSTAYCMAQFWSVKLDLVRKCNAKTREEIWRHSYESGLVDGNIIINAESQYGHTKDSCMTTQTFDTNTDLLWYTNAYKAGRAQNDFITKSVLFGCVSLYCFGIIVFNIITIVSDIGHISRNQLHTKSKLYAEAQNIKFQKEAVHATSKSGSKVKSKVASLKHIWREYFANDTFAWTIRNGLSQIIEIIIQSNALLLYNGYNPTDPTAYLANRPYLIRVFSVILAFNCFGAGMLWMAYGLVPTKCHGLLFELSLFLVDQSSDLFYTIFPFIMILTDNYTHYSGNTNDIFVVLGQLNINSTAAFVSAFFPLFVLCTQCLRLINSTKTKLRDRYYKQFQFIDTVHDIQAHTNPRAAVTDQRDGELAIPGTKYTIEEDPVARQLTRLVTTQNWVTKSTVDFSENRNDTERCCNRISAHVTSNRFKQIILVATSLFYIIYGIVVLVLVNNHISTAHSYCNLIKESNYFTNGVFNNKTVLSTQELDVLHSNPELFLWDNCLVQVLPFTKDNRYKCQCKVVVIEWDALQSTSSQRKKYFNLTQSVLVSSMLEKWYSLQKFRTVGAEASSEYDAGITITQSMFHSHMKAFEWQDAAIYCIEHGISAWTQLEYLNFENCFIKNSVPDDFGDLVEMKYLSFKSSSLQSFPLSICKLEQLQALHIEFEHNIESIPVCITDLVALTVLIIDTCVSLAHIPIGVFNMPNLMVLSLFRGYISYQSLMEYNVIIDDATINTDIEFYFELNPICHEDISALPVNLQNLVRSSCDYPCNITDNKVNEQWCSPRKLGDGHCDEMCMFCLMDHGDCAQLCFAEALTNCTYGKLTNDKCDPECDNKYCSQYESNGFTHVININGDNSTGDLFHCASIKRDATDTLPKEVNLTDSEMCKHSNSTYITDEFVKMANSVHTDWGCDGPWIADGECDDLCRTSECNNDGNDCELGCVSDCAYIFQAWNLFNEENVYNVNISIACVDIWPKAVALTGADASDCEGKLHDRDYNRDMHINFREFVSLSYWLAGGWDYKGMQLNCSQCMDMEHYNIANNAMDTTTKSPVADAVNTCNR